MRFLFPLLAGLALGVVLLPACGQPSAAAPPSGDLEAPTESGLAPRPFGLNVTYPPFGAAGNGLFDDTAAIQSAIDAAIAAGGDTVLLPRGTYLVRQTLHIVGIRGFELEGAGPGATTLLWGGNSTDPLIRIADCYSSSLRDLCLLSTPAAPLHTALLFENSGAVDVPPSRTTLENLLIEGTNDGGLEFGVRIALGAGGDNNNDFHVFEKVSVNNYRQAGFSLESAQAKAILFLGCVVSGNGIGDDGVATWRGAGARGGSFTWIGGGGGGNRHADFHLGDANAPVSIRGASFENSKMLLDTEGPSGAMWPVRIQDTRWAVNQATTPLEPHGYIIRFRFAGPLTIEGCSLSVFDVTKSSGIGGGQIHVESFSPVALTFVSNALALDSHDVFDGLEPTTHGSNLILRSLVDAAEILDTASF